MNIAVFIIHDYSVLLYDTVQYSTVQKGTVQYRQSRQLQVSTAIDRDVFHTYNRSIN